MTEEDSFSKNLISFKIAHTKELIIVFSNYMKDNPQHEEYYKSVVSHLKCILKSYETLMGTKHVTH